MVHWLIFLLTAAGIIAAGIKLASFAEAIGKRTGIGQGWIGLLFLATVTSFPELTTTITGASIGVPNIAVGNALGSNLFNIAIIGLMDILLIKRGPFLLKVRSYHIASGGIVVLLTALVMLGIVIAPKIDLFGISPVSFLILIVYVGGVFLLYHIEKSEAIPGSAPAETMPLLHAVGGFLACTAIIIVAGIFLVSASKAITTETAISGSVMGAVLVAIVTSLPELSASIGALRIGAYDMIIGNLFGSNMFNILTIFFADAAFRGGSILTELGQGAPDQLIVAALGIVLASAVIIAIGYRSHRRILGMGADALVLLVGYLVSVYLIINRGINV